MNRKQKRQQIKAYKSQEYKKYGGGAFGKSKFINRQCTHDKKIFNYGTEKNPKFKCFICGAIIKAKKEQSDEPKRK